MTFVNLSNNCDSWVTRWYCTTKMSIEGIRHSLILGSWSDLLVPYRLAGGTINLLPVRPSVRNTSVFRTFLCRLMRYWFEIWYMNSSWHKTDQVWVSPCLTYFQWSYCPLLKFSFSRFFSAVFWDIDLKFGIWTCHNIIQIKFEFRHDWLTFIGVTGIVLC